MFCLVPVIRPTDVVKGVKKKGKLSNSIHLSYVFFKPGEAVPSSGLTI